MRELFYAAEGGEKLFSVCALGVPAAKNLPRARHLTALELLGAALFKDYQIPHAVISREETGKPKLLSRGLFMNLSHTADIAVCALGTVPLGVDIEAPRPPKNGARRLFDAREWAWILQQPSKELAFSRLWTLKESCAKFYGTGLSEDFAGLRFEISGSEIRSRFARGEELFFAQFLFEGYVLSLCLPRRGADMKIQIQSKGELLC